MTCDKPSLEHYIRERLIAAKESKSSMMRATQVARTQALRCIANELGKQRDAILVANERDVGAAQATGMAVSLVDRLVLTDSRIEQMIEGVRQVAELPDVVGEVMEEFERPNGLCVRKVRVPMGVIAMIYESRPNVTVDAAALAIKTGNCAILRGGREAIQSNLALIYAIRTGLNQTEISTNAVQLIERSEREGVQLLIQAREFVDLVIPRGSASLIQRIIHEAHVPVIETGVGNCHVYVDCHADLAMARDIIINAKTQRPSACNSIESVLIHEAIAERFLPDLVSDMVAYGVELRICEASMKVIQGTSILHHDDTMELIQQSSVNRADDIKDDFKLATDDDFATEFLSFILAIKVVKDVDDAMQHIARFGTLHSEVIVTNDTATANHFVSEVDAAVVYHNASSRFTDGFEFGFGAEIGISTQKLHARGPMGLRELTSYKYVVEGNGQIRK